MTTYCQLHIKRHLLPSTSYLLCLKLLLSNLGSFLHYFPKSTPSSSIPGVTSLLTRSGLSSKSLFKVIFSFLVAAVCSFFSSLWFCLFAFCWRVRSSYLLSSNIVPVFLVLYYIFISFVVHPSAIFFSSDESHFIGSNSDFVFYLHCSVIPTLYKGP